MPLFAAALLALVLAACITAFPWDEIPGHGFPDRDNYIVTIENLMESGAASFDFADADILPLLLNEYLWREILIFAGNAFNDPAHGLLVVSFIAMAMTTTFVVRRAGVVYALLFLLSPLTIDLFISQSRSALALAIFTIALTLRQRILRYALMAAAFMVHSVGAVLFAIYMFNEFILSQRRVSSRTKLIAAALLGVAVSVVWVFLSSSIFTAVGDRRADQDAMLPASLSFALWWVLMAGVVIGFSRLRTRGQVGQCAMFAEVLLCTFVFGTAFGVGAVRFLSLSLPFVFIAIRSIREQVLRGAALAGMAVFNLIHASYWTL